MNLKNAIGLEAKPAEAKRCAECGTLCDDDTDGGPLYECGECGHRFNREAAGGNRCPECSRFGSRIADESCPECEAGELESSEAHQCTHCNTILDEADFPDHDCREEVAREQQAVAEREARESALEAERAPRRAEILALPLNVVIQHFRQREDDEPDGYVYFYLCEVNDVRYGETDIRSTGRGRKQQTKALWRVGLHDWDWDGRTLLEARKLPKHESGLDYSSEREAAEAMHAWLKKHLPAGSVITINHDAKDV